MFNFRKKKQVTIDFNTILYPPSAFNGYEIIDESKDNLLNIYKILTNNRADLDAIIFDNKYVFVDSLIALNYVTSDFEQTSTLVEIVDEINTIAQKMEYTYKISVDDILQLDDDMVKQAREKYTYLPHYDLNTCAKLLEAQNYELIQVFLDCGGLTMSVLPKDKVKELSKYTD